MRSKLLLLDLVLAAAVAMLALEVRDRWFEARKRADVVLGKRVKPLPPPAFAPLPAVQPVTAASFAEVVQKDLFASDRNPTVVVEVKAVPQMPELPSFYGMLNLGDGPMAILSAKVGQTPREIKVGENVGDFKLVALRREDVTFEWNGQTITKKTWDLAPKTGGSAAAQANTTVSETEAPPAPAQPVAEQTKVLASQTGFGKEVGGGIRACLPGDTSPAGTVRDGMKKIVVMLPMGPSCRWEAAQ